jgi:hypothetical protein
MRKELAGTVNLNPFRAASNQITVRVKVVCERETRKLHETSVSKTAHLWRWRKIDLPRRAIDFLSKRAQLFHG